MESFRRSYYKFAWVKCEKRKRKHVIVLRKTVTACLASIKIVLLSIYSSLYTIDYLYIHINLHLSGRDIHIKRNRKRAGKSFSRSLSLQLNVICMLFISNCIQFSSSISYSPSTILTSTQIKHMHLCEN